MILGQRAAPLVGRVRKISAGPGRRRLEKGKRGKKEEEEEEDEEDDEGEEEHEDVIKGEMMVEE